MIKSRSKLLLAVILIYMSTLIGCIAYNISNPLSDGADPWVIQHDGYYYFCISDGLNLYVSKSKNLDGALKKENEVKVWTNDGSIYQNVWAPELHFMNNKWYIYFAADDGNNDNHRMYVISSDKPQGNFGNIKKITTVDDHWAIDGTILNYDGEVYYLWSGWEGDVNEIQHLYIAKMINYHTLKEPRVKIASPEFQWEGIKDQGELLINEGPQILKSPKNHKVFIIYSANGSTTDKYCLGLIELVPNSKSVINPLDPECWQKASTPVFSGDNDTIISPGHASFVKSPDYTEDWIVYHAQKVGGEGGWDRCVHTQKFDWKENDYPVFGSPVPCDVLIPAPSGSIK